MAIERNPRKPLKENEWPPANSQKHKVKDSEDWYKVAEHYNMEVKDLIYFNFKTLVPEEINWYLKNFVGCRNTPDGKNRMFSSDAKPGIIYIPKTTLSFEVASVVEVPMVDKIVYKKWWEDKSLPVGVGGVSYQDGGVGFYFGSLLANYLTKKRGVDPGLIETKRKKIIKDWVVVEVRIDENSNFGIGPDGSKSHEVTTTIWWEWGPYNDKIKITKNSTINKRSSSSSNQEVNRKDAKTIYVRVCSKKCVKDNK